VEVNYKLIKSVLKLPVLC